MCCREAAVLKRLKRAARRIPERIRRIPLPRMDAAQRVERPLYLRIPKQRAPVDPI